MEKWSREEIEKHVAVWKGCNCQTCKTSFSIVSYLLQRLNEAEKRVAGECAEIAINESKYDRLSGRKSSENIATAIRKKYIGG